VQAEITWKGAVKFEAVSGTGHTVTLDGAPESGGDNAGMRPMEMVLIGTGGCSAYDVVHILKTGREPVDGCVAHLTAERAEEPPRVFTKIAMHFVVSGKGLSANKVGRAVALSAEKYCSASIMLTRGGVEVTHTFEVVESP
jgi:putative redox protein